MDSFRIIGGNTLSGEVTISGAKNVALKAIVASLLTDDPLIIHNIPEIIDVSYMLEVVKSLGMKVERKDHTVTLSGRTTGTSVPLDVGARLRTSSMVLGPMLARFGTATIPNPGGCRIGARPIDRHIEGLVQMGAEIAYRSEDGYFHAKASALHGTEYTFVKNTHTGTETLMLAAVLADGETVLENAAEEVEIDDLMSLLNVMGARIVRKNSRTIVIRGVKKLHGAEYSIISDRNEEVTFAIAAAVTRGSVILGQSQLVHLTPFADAFVRAGGTVEVVDSTSTRYALKGDIKPLDVVTAPHPGFMTDWQAPWAMLMTQASGQSTIHETVFESRFSYVQELKKMGAKIEYFDPVVPNPEEFYNFNLSDRRDNFHQAIRISGPTKLHNAVLQMDDLRAGATLVLAALVAEGESFIHGVEQIDRGYEKIEARLRAIGANIERIKE